MRYLTVLAAVVALLLSGSPASADPGWPRIPCASGAIDQIEVTDVDYLTLTGHLDCGTPEDDPVPRWGYAVYMDILPYGTLNDAEMRRYSVGNHTPFSDRMRVDRLPIALGICVVTDLDVRVACVVATRKSPTSPLMVGPTPVEDALVDRPVQRRSDGSPNPVCGHC